MDGPSQPEPVVVEHTRFCRPPHACVHGLQSLHWPATLGTATLAVAAVSMLASGTIPWAEPAASGMGAGAAAGADAFAVLLVGGAREGHE